MMNHLFSLIPEDRLRGILSSIHTFTGISTRLVDPAGNFLMTFGKEASYCSIFKKTCVGDVQCHTVQKNAGTRAQKIGESYLYSCHANLNHVAFPFVNQGELLGSAVIGPFLLGEVDFTLMAELAEKYHLSAAASLELYDELSEIPVLSTERTGALQKLVNDTLAPLIPTERTVLMHIQEKAVQQAKIGETIQAFKESRQKPSLFYFHQKEKELLVKVRTGSVAEVRGVLNEMMGFVLFSQGGQLEMMRIRAIELTTLLSRVAMDGGANADSIYDLNSKFLSLIFREQDLDDLCMLLQEVAESFMSTMFYEKDKGNSSIRKALRFIAENFYEHLDLAAVADFVQLSPSYLSTMFHQVVGTNFREYLCRVRVEESKRLLLTTEYSLADIAVSVGFPDQSYFCKVFRRIVGMSPGKYRSTPSEEKGT